MKKLKLIIAALAAVGALGLAACNTDGVTPGTTTPGTIGTLSLDPTVSAVQQAAIQGCAYVPAATTVASIITSFAGGGAIADMVGQVAQSICNAVVPAKTAAARHLRRLAGPPQVNGVPVHGYFLRR
jgi:hypothetical protein